MTIYISVKTLPDVTPDSLDWDQFKPPCGVIWSSKHGHCGKPAHWWHSATCCGYITFLCDRHHQAKLAREDGWLCAKCDTTHRPARSMIAALGKI